MFKNTCRFGIFLPFRERNIFYQKHTKPVDKMAVLCHNVLVTHGVVVMNNFVDVPEGIVEQMVSHTKDMCAALDKDAGVSAGLGNGWEEYKLNVTSRHEIDDDCDVEVFSVYCDVTMKSFDFAKIYTRQKSYGAGYNEPEDAEFAEQVFVSAELLDKEHMIKEMRKVSNARIDALSKGYSLLFAEGTHYVQSSIN